MTIILNETLNPISAQERVKINENWNRIVGGLTTLQHQITNLAGGGEVAVLLDRIEQAVTKANNAMTDTRDFLDRSTVELDELSSRFENVIDGATTDIADFLNRNTVELNELLSRFEDLNDEASTVINQIQTTNSDIYQAEQARDLAEQSRENAEEAREQSERNRDTRVDNIIGEIKALEYSPTVTYKPLNFITYQGNTYITLKEVTGVIPTNDGVNYRLGAVQGRDGGVQSVNGIPFDYNGDVPLSYNDIKGLEHYSGENLIVGFDGFVKASASAPTASVQTTTNLTISINNTQRTSTYFTIVEVKPNTTYVMSVNNSSTSTSGIIRVRNKSTYVFDSTDNSTKNLTLNTRGLLSTTIETGANDYYLLVEISTSSPISTSINISNLKLEEGTTPTPWSPSRYNLRVEDNPNYNLINKNKITRGSYINESGVIVSSTASNPAITDFINVKNFKYLILSGSNLNILSGATVFYDANKNYISGISATQGRNIIYLPTNAVYVRHSFSQNELNTIKLEKGKVVTPYRESLVETLSIDLANKRQENWISAVLTSGWTAFDGQTSVQYYKDELGIVRFRGRIKGGTIGTSAFVLPATYRPTQQVTYPSVNNNPIRISSDGSVTIVSGATTDVWLDSVSFRVEE